MAKSRPIFFFTKAAQRRRAFKTNPAMFGKYNSLYSMVIPQIVNVGNGNNGYIIKSIICLDLIKQANQHKTLKFRFSSSVD